MIDIKQIKEAAMTVKGWGSSNQAWLDVSEDVAVAVVGHIDEDGNEYPLITIDCDQYDQGHDSLPLAKFYATANPQAVLELIERLEATERLSSLQKVIDETIPTQIECLSYRLNKVESERNELRSKLEAAEKDAARYKFVLHLTTHGVALGKHYSVWDKPEEVTKRIDAAMKESGK